MVRIHAVHGQGTVKRNSAGNGRSGARTSFAQDSTEKNLRIFLSKDSSPFRPAERECQSETLVVFIGETGVCGDSKVEIGSVWLK